ncbi:MAG: rRNA maturation RNase YbeY [Bdellovibrio sp.]|nr:rRNA maturation RNase YbeY [Bdellovibrio sp.]
MIKIKIRYHCTLKRLRPEGFRVNALENVHKAFLKTLLKPALLLDIKGVKIVTWNVVLCGAQRIQMLNTRYRKITKSTDVLSFPLFDSLRRGHHEHPLPSLLALGDIFICVPVAQKQARQFDISLEQEILHLYTHGLLHLLGFDHELSGKEEKLMQRLEDQMMGMIYP